MAEASQQEIPSTYLTVTTENLLRSWGIELSNEEIQKQAEANDTFYRQIMRVPAKHLYNNILLTQTADLQHYCQEELVNLIFANYTVSVENPESGGTFQEESQAELDSLQEQFEEQAESLQILKEEHNEITENINTLAKKQLDEWRQLQTENAAEITRLFREEGVELSNEFQARLQKKLEQNAAEVDIPKDVLKSLKIKTEPDMLTKSIISTLLEE